MKRTTLAVVLLFTLATSAQELPSAPQPKPVTKQQHSSPFKAFNFVSPVRRHPKVATFAGIGAAAAAITALSLTGGGHRTISACACPATTTVPKP